MTMSNKLSSLFISLFENQIKREFQFRFSVWLMDWFVFSSSSKKQIRNKENIEQYIFYNVWICVSVFQINSCCWLLVLLLYWLNGLFEKNFWVFYFVFVFFYIFFLFLFLNFSFSFLLRKKIWHKNHSTKILFFRNNLISNQKFWNMFLFFNFLKSTIFKFVNDFFSSGIFVDLKDFFCLEMKKKNR